jgi:cation diffusion facilitator family transporter
MINSDSEKTKLFGRGDKHQMCAKEHHEKKTSVEPSKPPKSGEAQRFALLTLMANPLTKEQMMQKYHSYVMHYGLRAMRMKDVELDPSFFKDELKRLCEMHLIKKVNSFYSLTAEGRAEANKKQKQEERAHKFLSSGTAASKVSASANILLSGLKLSAGLLSNSMGLISDGFDSGMDVVASAAVYVGTKRKKQLLSTALVVGLMLIGGITLGYEGISRLMKPETVEAGLLPVLAALVSGIVSYFLSTYLRFVGKRTGNLSMVSQSLDNRNHEIIAVAVLGGITFAAFGLPIVDSLVSLIVSVLILKSVGEISVEAIKTARGEEANLSRFKAKWETKIDNYRKNYFKYWILLKLRQPMSVQDLTTEFEGTFSPAGASYLKDSALNIRESFNFKKFNTALLKEMVDQGWIKNTDGEYQTTRKGNGELKERVRHERHKHEYK